MLLPPLTRLTIGTIRQAETSGKRKCEQAICEEEECEELDEDEDGSAVTFKACSNGPFRKLSNLFGPVEWLYQRTKFKETSAVYKYLTDGYNMELAGEWEGDEGGNFDRERIALGHKGSERRTLRPTAAGLRSLGAAHVADRQEPEILRRREGNKSPTRGSGSRTSCASTASGSSRDP